MRITRRNFGKTTLATGATGALASTFSLLPSSVLGANEKVNVAFIGCGGMGNGDAKAVARTGLVNVVALCDIAMGTPHTANLEREYPDVPRFKDFRQMFDKMADEIDACTVAVPDHAHFPIAMRAMSHGIGVYVEKPLAHTFEECEMMMAAETKYKVVAQMGNQGHSGANFFQFKAWQEAGIIKDIHAVTAYMNKGRRWHPWTINNGFPTGEDMPEGLDWDTWLGTAQETPFSGKLHPGNWRGWYRFGNGAFGDWGPHTLDTVHRFLKLGYPSKITAEFRDGPNEWIFPMATTIRFDHDARGDMPACAVTWYDGTKNKPPRPPELEEDRKLEACGKILHGKELTFKGTTHGSALRIIPEEKMREMVPDLPRDFGKNSGHHENFVLAVKGEEQARSTFQVAAPLSQVFCLGVIAQRLGGELHFDPETKQVTNNKVANQLLKGPPPRKGWEEYYKLV